MTGLTDALTRSLAVLRRHPRSDRSGDQSRDRMAPDVVPDVAPQVALRTAPATVFGKASVTAPASLRARPDQTLSHPREPDRDRDLAATLELVGWRLGLATLAAASLAWPSVAAAQALLNVSYDPTRELYSAIDEAFATWWEGQGNARPTIEVSHGGSGSQARAVIDGLQADVVTLALAADIDRIAEAGLLPADWQTRLPHNASPYTSTIVFLVREGNPKGIEDWDDLLADGVEVITPNPKTSGGARWNYLAAWAWAEANGQDPTTFVAELYRQVPVLDSGARGATTTFAQRGIGDVLLAWENEAFLAEKQLGADQFDIVVPSVSVLAEPPVAWVDANLATPEEQALAKAYLEFLYTPEAQAIIFANFYRGWDSSAANPDDVARFPDLNLVSIADLGGWPAVQAEHFADGGIFDQIYEGESQ